MPRKPTQPSETASQASEAAKPAHVSETLLSTHDVDFYEARARAEKNKNTTTLQEKARIAIERIRDGITKMPSLVTALKDSVVAEREAAEKLREAEERRQLAEAIQLEWENMVQQAEPMARRIDSAKACIEMATSGLELAKSRVRRDLGSEHTDPTAAVLAADVVAVRALSLGVLEEGKQELEAAFTAHLAKMRVFGKENGIPQGVLDSLQNAEQQLKSA